MKAAFVLWLSLATLFHFSSLPMHAQAPPASKVELSELRAPSSPAFVLLGIEQTSISRPSNPRAFFVSMISALRSGGSIEFMPYWLVSHSDLTHTAYYKADWSQQFIRSLSFSFTAAAPPAGDDPIGTITGFGTRFLLFRESAKERVDLLLDSLKRIHVVGFEGNWPESKISDEARSLALAIQRTRGFQIEFAGAVTGNFPSNAIEKGQWDKFGAWLTASSQSGAFDFLFVARVLGNKKGNNSQNLFDLGIQTSLELDNLSFAMEYVYRWDLNTAITEQTAEITRGSFSTSSTYRLAGNLLYRYSDSMAASITVGRNFTEVGGNGNLIAQIGIDFGLGAIPIFSTK